MSDYFTILTAVGRAKIAAATSGGTPVVLSQMALGDGSGAAVTPVDTQTDLVNEVHRAALSSLQVDEANASHVIAELVVPSSVGGFTIREAGVYDADGDLFAVGNFPATLKPLPASGSARDLTIRVYLAVTNVAAVTISVADSEAYATRDFVRGAADFFAVVSATTTAPPGAPAAGARYLIPAGATGAWVAHVAKIAHWRGAIDGWQFIAPANGAQASPADSDLVWRKAAGAWAPVKTSPAAALYMHANFR